MNITKTVNKANMDFFEGTLNGTDIVLVKCGIGKVNAGICAQILAGDFNVTHIINTGVAGSLDARLDIGDIVVSTSATYHDMDVTVFVIFIFSFSVSISSSIAPIIPILLIVSSIIYLKNLLWVN